MGTFYKIKRMKLNELIVLILEYVYFFRIPQILGRLFFYPLLWTKNQHQGYFYQNVARVYKLPKHSSFAQNFYRQYLRHLIVCSIETIQVFFFPKRLKILGLEPLQKQVNETLANGKGLIVVTGHVGSWELVGHFLSHISDKKFCALAKPSRYSAWNRILERFRNRLGINVLWTDRKSIAREMLGHLKANQILGFVMDQKPVGRRGETVNFLSQPTNFVNGPAKMATKTGCPILGVFCLREGRETYRLIFEPIENQDQLTQRMASSIEYVIRQYPEQWLWSYKRWSKQS